MPIILALVPADLTAWRQHARRAWTRIRDESMKNGDEARAEDARFILESVLGVAEKAPDEV